mmetsp:Transcript_9359/g.13666  ORF Transcript_9359/g.13666 Transcript_9359/m.13666 type:complete len:324 (-) Transcript_9359:236-1207(-)
MLEECHVFLARLTNEFHCAAQLVHVIAAGQEGLPKQELSVYKGGTPHVNLCVVVGIIAQQFWGTVPSRHNVFCLIGVHLSSGQTEIANDQVAVGVDENIGGFQVAVHDAGRVDELQTLQHLVEEVLVVGVTEFLSHADQAVEIALVPVEHEVQVVEVGGSGWRGHDVTELDDVVVVGQMTQQLDFAKDTLRVDEILEHVRHFLDGDTVADDDVVGGAHRAVGAAGDVLEVLVADIDLEDVALPDVDLVVVAAASNVELFGSEADSTQVLAEAGSGGGSARAGLRGLLTLTEPLGCSGGRRRLHSRAHCRLLGTAGGACRASCC